MPKDRLFLALGAFCALAGVAMGAFGAHALSTRLAPDRLAIYETAARYQMYHAFGLMIVGLVTARWGDVANASGWAFVIGIVVFCGSLYALALGAPRWFGAITPIGGLAFMIGWGLLGWGVLKGSD
jgi:uncharacterized membrane protein YgdD (TMEM256/DUF423 family)